jgi:UPF0271 protein
MVVYQIGALMAIAAARGHKVTHVKFHGGLAHMGFADREIAETLVRAVKSIDPGLLFLALPFTESEAAAERAGLQVAREIFADRAYDEEGHLVSRAKPGAVHHAQDTILDQARRIATGQPLTASDGSDLVLEADTLCVHGDNEESIAAVSAIRQMLNALQKDL